MLFIKKYKTGNFKQYNNLLERKGISRLKLGSWVKENQREY